MGGGGVDERVDALDTRARAVVIRAMTAEAVDLAMQLAPLQLLGGTERGGRTVATQSMRGAWRLRVGLVGKPSAGKSTLFNALTRAGFGDAVDVAAAKVGVTPFTTIDPNVGPAYAFQESSSGPSHP